MILGACGVVASCFDNFLSTRLPITSGTFETWRDSAMMKEFEVYGMVSIFYFYPCQRLEIIRSIIRSQDRSV